MPAYITFIREKMLDQSEFEIYLQLVKESMEGHPIKILAAYGQQVILEGPAVEGVVIVEFPTIEDAKKWYNSEAYQNAAQHRHKGSIYTAVIVQGV
jgi:uncharacterized protein (DUF1330 family)